MQIQTILFLAPFTLLLLFVLAGAFRRPTHAGGIVCRELDGRTLFLIVSSTTAKDKWVLPKGHIEKSETAKVTAVREVLEEAGVVAKPVKRAGIVRYRKKGKASAAVYFLMDFVSIAGPGLENRQVAWVDKDEVLKRLRGRGEVRILRGMKV